MSETITYRGDYIQGKFLKAGDPNGEILSQNPGDLDAGTVHFPFRFEHVNEAVTAARRAFVSWRRIPLSDRLALLAKYRDTLRERTESLAALISFEIGKPSWEARQEVSDLLHLLEHHLAEENRSPEPRQIPRAWGECTGAVRFKPRGVVALFGATDMPAFGPHRFLLPALLHGNTVVLKSSKYAPSVSQFLAQAAHDAGFPAGTWNVLHGDFELGRRLVSHEGVNIVYFTGSYEKGVRVHKQLVTDHTKLVVMETGGKNGIIVWEDCDYSHALHQTLASAFITSGQRHTCARRILVHQKIFDRFLEDFHNLAKRLPIGYGPSPAGDAPFMGPLISEKAVSNYLSFQGIAIREGCEEIMRGKTLEREQRGYYVSPSIHLVPEANPKSVYETSEIFGPNAAIYRIADLEEASRILNHCPYGLTTSLFSASRKNFDRLLDELNMGTVYWNLPTTLTTEKLPLEGLRKSGNARPLGASAGYQCTYPLSSLEGAPESGVPLPETLPRLPNAK